MILSNVFAWEGAIAVAGVDEAGLVGSHRFMTYVVDPARARGRSGTGLGLAIVKHIIEAHGGTIAAQSELGVGTVFRSELPAGLQKSDPVI